MLDIKLTSHTGVYSENAWLRCGKMCSSELLLTMQPRWKTLCRTHGAPVAAAIALYRGASYAVADLGKSFSSQSRTNDMIVR